MTLMRYLTAAAPVSRNNGCPLVLRMIDLTMVKHLIVKLHHISLKYWYLRLMAPY